MTGIKGCGLLSIQAVTLTLVASVAFADVRIEVASAIPEAPDHVTVDVILRTDGEEVGGFQNDIVFDHTAVRLESASSCQINPAIGTTPFGVGQDVVTCNDDSGIGPCKTLSRALAACEGDPPPDGCPAEAPAYSRLRAIVAGTEVFNHNSIPDESIVYSCTFEIVNTAALPVRLFTSNVVAADPQGARLPAAGEDGGVCDGSAPRCATLRDINDGCTIDFECASGHCDRCCGHQFNGVCAAPRTATPTNAPSPTRTPPLTRTPTATRSATATRTATSTPTAGSPGDRCDLASGCTPGFACNLEDGGICCSSETCPAGMSCRVGGLEGYCIQFRPTSGFVDAVVAIGTAAPDTGGVAPVAVSFAGEGALIGGLQNDILFDNTVVALDVADCRIAPDIGLFPLGQESTTCLEDASIGPCKNLSKALSRCGSDPQPDGCPPGAGDHVSVFRGIVAATAAPNNNPIPDGVVYTCDFEVVDAGRLPAILGAANVVVSNPTGSRLTAFGFDGRIERAARCLQGLDCESGNCVDGFCCAQASCPAGQSCGISGAEGVCSEKRAIGDDCNFGVDCQSLNCDLIDEAVGSTFRGVCGEPRGAISHPGECDDAGDCDSGNCVDGFCCAADACPAGQFCNTGECAAPAEPGARCTANEQCALGLCVDGACCVTGECPDGLSCGVPTREGVCREPFRLGSPCTLDIQCPTSFCTDGVCCESDACDPGFRCDLIPGQCVPPPPPSPTFHSEPSDPAGDSATPTRTLPAATPTIVAGPAPSSSATPGGVDEPFSDVGDDGCHMSPRPSGSAALWTLLAGGLILVVARRKAR
jgi:hypothetical protein